MFINITDFRCNIYIYIYIYMFIYDVILFIAYAYTIPYMRACIFNLIYVYTVLGEPQM